MGKRGKRRKRSAAATTPVVTADNTATNYTKKRGIHIRKVAAAPRGVEEKRYLATIMQNQGTGNRLSKDENGVLRMTSDRMLYGEGTVINQQFAPSYLRSFNLQELDIYALTLKDPYELVMELADISPDISRVMWDWLRLANCGWKPPRAYRDNDKDYPKAQKALDAFLERMKEHHGSLSVLINRLLINAGIYGGFFTELLMNDSGKMALDILAVDPAVARFKRVKDPVRGMSWQLGQYNERGQWVDLNVPTVKYLPIDPIGSSPFGRPIWTAGLYASLFLLGMLYDLRRVVAQQGYPRHDVAINIKGILESMDGELKAKYMTDGEAFDQLVDDYIRGTAAALDALAPDDAFVHTENTTINRPVGASGSDLKALESLISAIERIAVRGLKTMTFLQNVNANVDAQTANRQWEVHTKGIQAIQKMLQELLEVNCQLALQAEGMNAKVVWEFETVRLQEMLRDEQVFQMKLENAATARDEGFFSQEQASYHAVDGKPDKPEPRVSKQQQQAPVGQPANQGVEPPAATAGTPEVSDDESTAKTSNEDA